MTEQPTEEAGAPQPAPTSEAPEQPKERKEPAKKDSGLPVGQIAVGGLGATVLGSAALVSVVGPLGWLAAPAAATAGGVGYVAYRRRKKHGRTTGRRTQQSKTVTSRTVGGGRLGGAGMSGGRGRTAGVSTRSGGAPVGSRRASGAGAATASRPASGGRSGGPTVGRGRSSGPSPYSGTTRRGGSSRGSSPRGLSPRGGSRPSSPRGLFGRGSDTTSRKRTSRPGSSGGGTTPRGGPTPKNRWGGGSGGSGHHKGRGSRIGRGAARARDWADDRTGRKASAAWKAASGQRGFRARSKAASRAVRSKGAGRIISSAVGVITAAFAGLASLLGRSKTRKPSRRTPPLDTPAGWYAKDGYKLGPEVPGMPGAFYADPRDTRPGYVDDRGYTTGSYDANIDPRTWDERVAAGDVPGFSPKTTTTTTGGTTMTGNRSLPHAQHAADMLASVTRHEPEDLFVVIDQARQWPDFVRDTAMAVRTYVQVLQANRFPLKNSSVEALQELYAALLKTMPAAEAIHTQMCIDHAVDLDRANFDRGDERRANVR